jgi:GNAT superfamily N-acetyltransferase
MSKETSVTVRAMRRKEAQAIREIAKRSFPPQAMLFFSFTKHVLVAEVAGEPVGGLVMEVFGIPGGRRGGIVLWFFVDPAARRQGVGQALVQASLAFFAEQGCTDLFACVEGNNTSSARRWAQSGFGILSPGAQLARYGLGILPVWWGTRHLMDIGHMLWARPPSEAQDRPWLQWWGVLLMNTLLMALALWRQNGFGALPLAAIGLCGLTALIYLGARSLAMVGAARAQGLKVRYRAWESGFPLGVAIAALMGGYYANPGGWYPTDEEWRYRDLLPKLGPMALAGAGTTLALLAALRWWDPSAVAAADAPMWQAIARWVGTQIAVLDILLPVFPLESFNGRRIWDWNRWVWAAMAAITLALLLL